MHRIGFFCRRWRPRLPRLRWPVMALLVVVAAWVILDCLVGPPVREMVAYQARVLAMRAVNEAVSGVMNRDNITYEQLAVVSRNEAGEVTSIQSDMVEINRLTTEITGEILDTVTTMGAQRISVPLGTLLGGQIFSGRGPGMEFLVIPTGYIQTGISNRFEETGINQTRHQIMMTVEVGVTAIMPLNSAKTTLYTGVCLAETVIVGTVPDSFTKIEKGGESALPNLVADYGAQNVPQKDVLDAVK